MFNLKAIKVLLSLLFIMLLTACGGGDDGGGSNGEDISGGSDVVDNTVAPLVESDATLSEVIEFEGAETRSAEIPAPTVTEGGTLTVSNEVAVTSGGVSAFNIQPNLPDDYAVHAYLFSIPDTSLTHLVYLGNELENLPTSLRTVVSDLPEVLVKNAQLASSLRTAQADPYRPTLSVQPMRLTNNYSTELVVQAYVRPASEDLIPFTNFSEFWDNMDLSSTSWTAPSTINLNAVSVGEGTMQVTLTWDTEADIDLHIIEPSDNDIYWFATNSPVSDGYLDIDDINGFGPENIYFEDSYAEGTYRIEVHHFSGTLPTNYTITVKNGSSVSNYSGLLSADGEKDIVTSFTTSGANADTDTENDSGTDTGNDSGTDTGNDSGTDTGNDSGTDTGNDSGTDTGNDSGTDTGNDLGGSSVACGVDVTYSGMATISMCFNNYPTEACQQIEETYQDNGYNGGTTVYQSCPSSYGGCIIDFENEYEDIASIAEDCVSY